MMFSESNGRFGVQGDSSARSILGLTGLVFFRTYKDLLKVLESGPLAPELQCDESGLNFMETWSS